MRLGVWRKAVGTVLAIGLNCSLGLGPAQAAELTPQKIYAQAAPAVVLVVSQSDQAQLRGTGSILRRDGLVVTNAHVIIDAKTKKPFDRVFVFLKPERVTGNFKNDLSRSAKAKVVAVNEELDLALLKMEVEKESPAVLELADPNAVQIGDRVAAIGHPEQGGLWTLTTGVVSAEFDDFGNKKGKDVFQTETGLNRGNSGGPLVDRYGHQIGVNTSIARLAEDGLPITSISFAVKTSVVRDWLRQQGVELTYAAPPAEAPKGKDTPPPPAPPPGPPAVAAPPSPGQSHPPAGPSKASEPAPHSPSPPAVATPPPQKPSSPLAGPPKASESPAPSGPRVHTEAHPFKEEALFDHVRRLESELTDLAEEMRQKIPRR